MPKRAGVEPGPAPANASPAALDLTGYWVSLIVDEWRFRVTPQKGDILYLPINAEARPCSQSVGSPRRMKPTANDARLTARSVSCNGPGRLHITWENDNTLQDRRRLRHADPLAPLSAALPAQKGEPSWQGYSAAHWVPPGHGRGSRLGMPRSERAARNRDVESGNHQHAPGYMRKNGVPYSEMPS